MHSQQTTKTDTSVLLQGSGTVSAKQLPYGTTSKGPALNTDALLLPALTVVRGAVSCAGSTAKCYQLVLYAHAQVVTSQYGRREWSGCMWTASIIHC